MVMLVTNYSNGCNDFSWNIDKTRSLHLRVLKVFVPFGLSKSNWHIHKTALMIIVLFAFKNLDGITVHESFFLKPRWIGGTWRYLSRHSKGQMNPSPRFKLPKELMIRSYLAISVLQLSDHCRLDTNNDCYGPYILSQALFSVEECDHQRL